MHRISALVVTLSLSTALCLSAQADHCWEAPALAAPFGELFLVDGQIGDHELPAGCSIIVAVPDECQESCVHSDQVKLVSEGKEVPVEIIEREGFNASREYGCGHGAYGEYDFESGAVSYSAYEIRPAEPLAVGAVVTLHRSADVTVLSFTVSEADSCDEATPEPQSIAPCSPGAGTCVQAQTDNQIVDPQPTDPGVQGASTKSLDADQGGCVVSGTNPATPIMPCILLGLAMIRRRRRECAPRSS